MNRKLLKIKGRRHLKVWMFTLTGLTLLLLCVWPGEKRASDTAASKTPSSDNLNLVIQPQIKSIDQHGQPYEIKAESAERIEKNGETIMVLPEGKIALDKSVVLGMTAETGCLSQNADQMTLQGKATVKTEDGYTLNSTQFDMNITEKTAETDKMVHGTSPQGTVDAQGMKIDQQGDLAFKGETHMVFMTEEK